MHAVAPPRIGFHRGWRQCRNPSVVARRRAIVSTHHLCVDLQRGNRRGNRASREVFPRWCIQSMRVTINNECSGSCVSFAQFQSALGLVNGRFGRRSLPPAPVQHCRRGGQSQYPWRERPRFLTACAKACGAVFGFDRAPNEACGGLSDIAARHFLLFRPQARFGGCVGGNGGLGGFHTKSTEVARFRMVLRRSSCG
jgi:hypothetical protein